MRVSITNVIKFHIIPCSVYLPYSASLNYILDHIQETFTHIPGGDLFSTGNKNTESPQFKYQLDENSFSGGALRP